jgi:hypothetical protein
MYYEGRRESTIKMASKVKFILLGLAGLLALGAVLAVTAFAREPESPYIRAPNIMSVGVVGGR